MMAYIKLELLQETLVMQGCVRFVVCEMIFPVLLMRGQYLQSVVLQKEKPLSWGADPCLLVCLGMSGVLVEGPGMASTCRRVGSHRKKSMITCCIGWGWFGVVEVPEGRIGFEGSRSVAGGWV